jgi:hypothetical protein
VLREQFVHVPSIDLLTKYDALEAAERNDKDLARAIFQILLRTNYCGVRVAYRTINDKRFHRIVSTNFRQCSELWSAWAWYEEKWGEFGNVVSVYEEAIDALDGEALSRIETDLRIFLSKVSKLISSPPQEDVSMDQDVNENSKDYTDEDEPMQTSRSGLLKYKENDSPVAPTLSSYTAEYTALEDSRDKYLISSILARDSTPESADATPRPSRIARIPRKSTPFARKIYVDPDENASTEQTNSITSTFKNLNINSVGTPSILKKGQSTRKKNLGVRFVENSPGSTVTILTPIRPPKKEREGTFKFELV